MKFNFKEMSKECAKGLLILMNASCMLYSILLFAFAVVDTRTLKQYGEDEAIGTFGGDMFVIALCLMLFAVAVLGLIGVIRENVKVLYVYAILVLVLAILEMLVGIYVGVQRSGLEIRVTDWLREDFFKNLTTTQEITLHEAEWNELETNHECCGLNGPEDYLAIGRPISMACCPRALQARTATAQQQLYKACLLSKSYYEIGCEDAILYSLDSYDSWLMGVAIFSFWFQAGGVFMSMWVAKNIKNSVTLYKETVKY